MNTEWVLGDLRAISYNVLEKGAPRMQAEPQDKRSAVSYTSILEEHDVARAQRESRTKLLRKLVLPEFNGNKGPNGIVAHIAHDQLMSADIPILGNVLLAVGDVETLNLLLHSPRW
ncbi:MAG: hypothetical protein GX591_06730 [Planctomycetes bacterium]|nr:hypothetical protein [Planctomycetota bacterium]